jgi:superfamily II DNA or RNA helicase
MIKDKVLLDTSNTCFKGATLTAPLTFIRGWKKGLYNHQMEAVAQVLSKGSGVLKLATGTGKTWIIAELCRKIQCNHILVVAAKIDLLHQITNVLKEYLKDTTVTIDSIGDGNKTPIWADITVGLVGSLNKISNLDVIDYVIYDESHKYINQSGIDLYNKLVNVKCITALSATPYTDDYNTNDLVTKLYGPLLYELTEKEAIQLGCISLPVINLYKAPKGYCPSNFINCNFSHFAYNKQINSLIINNKGRNDLIVDLIQPNKSTIIIVNKVNTEKNNHAVILKDLIETKYGKTKEVYIVKGGDVKGLSHLTKPNCIVIAGPNILNEGTNIPSLEVVVLAAANSSPTLLLQRVGRVLRKSFTKTYGEVIDFIDPIGWPAGQSRTRLLTYKTIYGEENIFIN